MEDINDKNTTKKGIIETDQDWLKRRSELHECYAKEIAKHGPITDFARVTVQQRTVSGEEIKQKWREFIMSNQPRKLNFYTHIPFCLKKCPFCPYVVKELKNPADISNYIETISLRYRYFAESLTGGIFSNMYFSGGTPNILNNRNIEKMFASIYENYKFSEDSERTFEGNVIFADHDKLELLKNLGINRISFGTQSLDNLILDTNGKYRQNYELIERTVKDSLTIGFDQVHLSVIAGFADDTEDIFLDGFKKTIKIHATSVSVYPMKLEGEYINHFFAGDESQAKEYVRNFTYRILPKIFEAAYEEGYCSLDSHTEIKSRYDFYRSDKQFRHQYITDNDSKPTSVLGFGIGSGSKIAAGKILARVSDFAYDPQKDVYEASYFSQREQCLDYMIRRFSQYKEISNNDLRNRFGADIKELFGADKIRKLADNGIIEVSKDKSVINEDNPDERVKRLFFFSDEEDIRRGIEKCRSQKEA